MTSIKREAINSITLRQKFPEHYENLFSVCQIVVSTSDTFFWAGEYARFFGGLAIEQKLPTKNLVGLEILNEKKIVFADKLFGYSPSVNVFEHIPFDTAKEIRLLNFLKEYWPTIDKSRKIKGFKIHILSESHCGGGLGTTGNIMACLAATLLILANQIEIAEIEKWRFYKTEELINNPQCESYESFQKVFRLAWRLTAICRDGNASGATSFAALIHSPYPIIYFSENINNYLKHQTIASPDSDVENCQIIEEIPFWGGKLEELFPFHIPQPWPLDIGRVYSGALINTEMIFKSLSKLKFDIENLKQLISKELTSKIQSKNLSIKYIFGLDREHNLKCSYYNYLDIFNLLTVEMLLSLKDLFTLGLNENSLRDFTTTINRLQDFNHFLGHSTPLLDKICDRFSSLAAEGNEFKLASAKIEGVGRGGHVIFTGLTGLKSTMIIKETENLSEETGKDVSLDWASWIDGFGESGLTIEQFLPEGKYSDFITSRFYSITQFKKGIKENKMIEPSKIKSLIPEFDLVLMTPEQRIYVGGKVLSSKDLSSAKKTIEIVSKILASGDLKINNKSFNDSSYGQNRYDLQSKIFIPLAKALKKIAKKELEFEIHGGMYDNFSISLKIKNLDILFVEETK